ncbi:hypothetical protein DFS34DRAFT_594001 [Phlyctochytrium arcticum]|nr:hypothetical protein DFS34DRAFT_594001 [Phlyctochytrium arcticum]
MGFVMHYDSGYMPAMCQLCASYVPAICQLFDQLYASYLTSYLTSYPSQVAPSNIESSYKSRVISLHYSSSRAAPLTGLPHYTISISSRSIEHRVNLTILCHSSPSIIELFRIPYGTSAYVSILSHLLTFYPKKQRPPGRIVALLHRGTKFLF